MSAITREQMDALVDGHYRAEEAADLDAIAAGFVPGAEHDVGSVFGIQGRGRAVRVRLLHVFDFDEGLIGRESAWLDVASLQRQLEPR